MTYVVSDLHGFLVWRLKERLEEVGFGPEDRLFVLGDCIDRGSHGLALIKWIMSAPNVTMLLGNHEDMMLENRSLFEGEEIPAVWDLVGARRESYALWVSNGGMMTIDEAQTLPSAQLRRIIDFIAQAPLYATVTVGEREFVLTHSGLGHFSPDKPLSEYTKNDLIWTRPSFNERYYEDGRTVVFGHTPTLVFGPEYKGKPIVTDTWINIDVGAAAGLSPMILRLDDMERIYL